jgi:citrate lyase subunit beta/citryl-CoA lyase
VSVDCPYTYADTSGCRADTMYARRLGYSAKLINHPEHVAAVNDALTPSEAELAEARAIISAFDVEHRGLATNQVGGRMLELPIYLNAQRLLARAEALNAAAAAG